MVVFSGGGGTISQSIFKVNQRLTVALSKRPNADQYSSRIEEVRENSLLIAMPMSKGQPIILLPDTKIFGKMPAAGAMYSFSATYLDKKTHPLPMWIISMPEIIDKFQQRSFVRIDAAVPVVVSIFSTDPNDVTGEEKPPFKTLTKDVGGGGIQLICNEPIKMGTRMRLAIELPDGVVETLGEVMRVYKPQEERPLYWIGVRFIDIPEILRNRVIKFIFKLQLELRQKEHK